MEWIYFAVWAVPTSLVFIYFISYWAGKGWFNAKLEFHQKHQAWVKQELSDDRQS